MNIKTLLGLRVDSSKELILGMNCQGTDCKFIMGGMASWEQIIPNT